MSTRDQALRFAYSTINWGTTTDLPQAFAEIQSTGWGAVELFGHALDWLGTPNWLRQQLNGLRVATLFGSVGLPSSTEQIETQKRRIEYAAEVGAAVYGLVGGARLRYRTPYEHEYRELADLCEQLADYGAGLGVTVCYHPHVGCTVETSAEIDRLLDGTQRLQLCLDASHIALVDEDPIRVMDHYWDRMGYVHLKDWGQGKFRELGRGSIGIDFPAILRHLEERQYPGWVVLEQSQSDESPCASAQINADYLHNLGYDIR